MLSPRLLIDLQDTRVKRQLLVLGCNLAVFVQITCQIVEDTFVLLYDRVEHRRRVKNALDLYETLLLEIAHDGFRRNSHVNPPHLDSCRLMATDFTLFPYPFTRFDKHFRNAPFAKRDGRERNVRGMPNRPFREAKGTRSEANAGDVHRGTGRWRKSPLPSAGEG